jgi:hypothetical protein
MGSFPGLRLFRVDDNPKWSFLLSSSAIHGHRSELGSRAWVPGLPSDVEHLSLTSLREKLVKIGAKVVAHGRYVTFQMVEVAVPRDLFGENPAADR